MADEGTLHDPGAREPFRPWRAALCALILALLGLGANLLPNRAFLPEDPRLFAPLGANMDEAEREAARAAAIPSRRDAILQFLPFDTSVAERWREGRVPLWETRYLCGAPMLAQVTSRALYPSALLFQLFGPGRGALWNWLLHLVLAGFFAYVLARRLHASEGGALLANASTVLSGYAWAHVAHPMIFMAAIWLLPALVAADRLVRDEHATPRHLSLSTGALALCITLSWLAGFSQASVLVCYAVTGYVAVHAARRLRQRHSQKPVLLAALGVAIGLALAAPQILPTLELASHSARLPTDEAKQRQIALRAVHLLDFVMPGQLAAPQDVVIDGTPRPTWLALLCMPEDARPTLAAGAYNATETALGFGIWPFFFALQCMLALFSRGTPARLSRAILAGLAAFALGTALALPGFFQIATSLPGFAVGDVRRLAMVPAILLPVLAGCGFGRLRIPIALGSVITGFVLVAAGLALFAAREESLADQMIEILSWRSGIASDAIASAFVAGELAINQALLARGVLLVGLSLMLGGALGRMRRGTTLVFVAACALEMLPIAWASTAKVGAEAFEATKPEGGITAQLPPIEAGAIAPRVLRIDSNPGGAAGVRIWPPNLPMLAGYADVLGYAPIPPRRFERWIACIEKDAPSGGAGIARLREPSSLAHPLLELAGIDKLVTSAALAEQFSGTESRWKATGRVRDAHLYERRRPAQRVRLYESALQLESPEAASEAIEAAGFDPSQTLVVEGSEDGSGDAAAPATDVAEPTIRVLRWSSGEIEVAYAAPRASWAFVAEGWMPGWLATIEVEGEDAPRTQSTRPAQLAFQALRVPAGRGTIRLRYAPASFRHGLLVALAGLIALLATLTATLFPRRRRA